MKHFIISAFMLLFAGASYGQTTKIVVDLELNFMGRYVGESATHLQYYDGTDKVEVSKQEAIAKVFTAAEDGGFLWPTCEGSINIRQKPTTSSAIVAKWPINRVTSYNPYDCVGYKNGWYKVKTPKGKVGWVRGDLVRWDIGFLD